MIIIRPISPSNVWFEEGLASEPIAATNNTPTKAYEMICGSKGIVRVQFVLSGYNNTQGQIYLNGVAEGTLQTKAASPYGIAYTEDISIEENDLLQIYINGAVASYGFTAYLGNIKLGGSREPIWVQVTL